MNADSWILKWKDCPGEEFVEPVARAAVAKGEDSFRTVQLTAELLHSLKEDYLAWTGGFTPAGDDEITVYINTSMPFEIDKETARLTLKDWMANAWQDVPKVDDPNDSF